MHQHSSDYASALKMDSLLDKFNLSEEKLVYGILTDVDKPNLKTRSSTAQQKNSDMHVLLKKVVQKDQQALTALYNATINLLYGVALRITQNHEMTEEVINETYMQVWKQANRYNSSKSTVNSWLVMICRSRAIDMIRRNRKSFNMQELEDSIADQDALPLPDLMIAVEQKSNLYCELNNLSHSQQQLLSLSFFRGFTQNEMAKILDMPLGTVKTQIRRAILQLKKRLADLEEIQYE